MSQIDQMEKLLKGCSQEQRREIFHHLRSEFSIHPLEEKLNTTAEIILEAIERSSDLTQRGIRGVIAEASFEIHVITRLSGWKSISIVGDAAYDFLIQDSVGRVRIQVKMQRLKDHQPMRANQAYRFLPEDHWVSETQRTRGGIKNGQDTRPYKFGEFDILAVSMHPSTNDWRSFMYTVSNWLIPRLEDPALMLKFQPVAMHENDVWTGNLETAIKWLRSNEKKAVFNLNPR